MTLLLELLVLLGLLAVAGLLAWDLTRPWRRRRRDRDRLEALGRDEHEEESPRGRLDPLARRMRTAGLPFGPLVLIALLVLLGASVVVLLLWLVPQIPALALVGAAVSVYVAWVGIREWAKFRARRFERHLVDAVDFMVSALMAGENPTQALASSATTADGAVRRELEEAGHRLELGLGIRSAMQRMRERYDSEGVRLFSQTLVIKWQAGGDLAPVLRKVAWIMRERIRMTMRLRTELTGVQIAGLAVAVLPYILIPVYLWIRPEWTETLMTDPMGPPLIGMAIILQVFGLLWLRRILAVEL